MSKDGMFTVRVPASTANLGPGFDSIGVALNLYLTVEAEQSESWEVIPLSKELEVFPTDDQHFIVKMARKTASLYDQQMPPCRLAVSSEIPLTRGLGSSAAAIIAGIELANYFCDLKLTNQDKLEISAEIEGHPDNVGASIYGGFVVGSQLGNDIDLTVLHSLEMDVVAIIPEEELLTESARGVLPDSLPFSKAVEASAVSNQLLAALLTKNWGLAGKMMSFDRFHQPYRRGLIPWWGEVEAIAIEAGAFGTALSGAGPTILCLVEPGKGKAVAAELDKALSTMHVVQLEIDRVGSETYIEMPASKKSPI
ncbi:homoserine kinase [Mesobacillus persicus]|uniref:Homoserine kinase n=1 Tax=Mesobacillus persicus TaxID=930146 RepID=A0A1H7ZU23_9BACI|nr:homoserine kinase [Mesobacillus persicus]SEM61801.1 homoserine kinase [Mesobacillus persicus]